MISVSVHYFDQLHLGIYLFHSKKIFDILKSKNTKKNYINISVLKINNFQIYLEVKFSNTNWSKLLLGFFILKDLYHIFNYDFKMKKKVFTVSESINQVYH